MTTPCALRLPGAVRSGRRRRRTQPPPRRALRDSTGRKFALTVPREGAATGVPRRVVELFLDAQQLVELGHALGAGRRTGLDLAAADGDGEVGDRGVLGLTGAVAHHRLVPGPVREVDRVERL